MSVERDLLAEIVEDWNKGNRLTTLLERAERLLSETEEIKIVVDNNAYRQGYQDGKAFANRHGEISLRDHFAGLAMQSILTSDGRDVVDVAEWSYAWADAMLKEREKINE